MKSISTQTYTLILFLIISILSSCNNEETTTQKEKTAYEIYEVCNTYKDEKDPFLNMRNEANSDSKIIAKLYDGKQLYLLNENYNYDYTKYCHNYNCMSRLLSHFHYIYLFCVIN